MANCSFKKHMLKLSLVSFISMLVLLLIVIWYLHSSILKEKKDLIHSQVSTMMSLAEVLYEETLDNTMSEKEAQDMFINYTDKLKYSKNGYFWMMKTDGMILTNPYKKKILSELLIKEKSIGNYNLINNIIQSATKGGGFIYYKWFKSTDSRLTEKLGYVEIFKPWGWIIGSGVYIDTLNYQIICENITGLFFISILFLLSISLSLYLSRNYLTEFHHKAIYDSVTRLYTRGYLDEQGPRMLKKQKDVPLAVIFFDIDLFKKINDQYGHRCGDDVLAAISSIIQKELLPHKNVFRYGGEELIVLLYASELVSRNLAEKVRVAIAQHCFYYSDNESFHITISAGVAVSHSQESFSDIVRRADRCMYFAKARGRNRVVTETETRDVSESDVRDIPEELR